MSSNVEIARHVYEVFARDGLDGILPLFDEEIEWRNPEDSPTTGVWHGHQGVRDWFAELRESFNEMRFLPYEFKELSDARVLVLLRAAVVAKRSGVEMEVPFAHLITIRDALVTRFQMYSDQQRAIEAADLEVVDP